MVKVSDDISAKKRKKNTSTSETVKPDDDIYRKVVAYEEAEARTRSAEKDAKLYCRTCESIREMLAEIQQLKKSPVNDELNRLEKIRTKASRDALHKEKQRVDSTQLQLHNLLYELEHLKKEITKCLQFKSTDEEIDLVSVEEFYKEAPEFISRAETTKSDDHQLRLARLEWELRQRKQLSEFCHKLQAGKAQAASQIISKQERLDGLAPRLNHVLDVTKPLQEYLDLSLDKTREQHKLAYLLPDPLFLLFFQSDAYNQVYDKSAFVNIVGDEDEAKQLKNVTPEIVSDSESDQDLEEQNERNKRHHRKVSRSDRQEERRQKLLAAHPLSVQVSFKSPASSNDNTQNVASLEVMWKYLPQLHIVTTQCEISSPATTTGISAGDVLSKDTILSELFESDFGEDSPNSANYYQLRQVGLGKFPTLIERLGRPYNWAQRICGLDFLAPPNREGVVHIPNRELSQTNIEIVLKKIRKRFLVRLALFKQIQTLEQCSPPSLVDIPNMEEYPDKLKSNLTTWKITDWLEVSKLAHTKTIIDQQIISPTNMLYKATVTRSTAKLTAIIAIQNDFPTCIPHFCLLVEHCGEWTALNSDAVRDMERCINVEWKTEDNKSKSSWILSAQLRRLLACFDIYLETLPNAEFSQEKIFFKAVRGRHRKRPLKYLKIGGGIFTQ